MELALLIYPHQNVRYRESILQITTEEIRIVMESMEIPAEIKKESIGGAPFLLLKTERSLTEREMRFLWQSAGIYMIFSRVGDTMVPLSCQRMEYIGEDLASLLKYKGKTNEMFTDSMISLAVAKSDFSRIFDSQLIVCDPMAGKGTTVMLALRRGYHGIGIEISKADVEETAGYMDRYFKFHKMKYKHQQSSLTVKGKSGGQQHKWIFSDTAENFKDGDTRSMRMILGDTRNALAFLRSGSVHLMVTDLPYGVQRGTSGKDVGILQTVRQAISGWYDCLKPGGVLCMSFNTHTVRRDDLLKAGLDSGFAICETGSFKHWVEQAIERDLVLLKKESIQA